MSNEAIFHKLASYFEHPYDGVFVEVGAGHPVNISISNHFRGLEGRWKIVSIDPIPEHCDEFRKLGLPILQFAVAEIDIGLTAFYLSPNLICCSGLIVDFSGLPFGWQMKDFKKINVVALSLDTILGAYHPEISEIDVLVVDAEGFEVDIMKGLDLKKYNPKVVCIEGHASEKYMKNQGYRLDYQIHQDKIFLKN